MQSSFSSSPTSTNLSFIHTERPCYSWSVREPIWGQVCRSPTFSVYGIDSHLSFYTTNDDKWTIDFNSSRFHQVYVYIYRRDGRLVFLRATVQNSMTKYFDGNMQIWQESPYKPVSEQGDVYIVDGYIKFLFVFDKVLYSASEIENTVESPSTSCFQAFSEDIENMLKSEKFYDVTLRCEGRCFRAHRNILSTRSDVFSAMLENPMREKDTGIVDIKGIESETLELVLKYIYSGKIKLTSMDETSKIYEAAVRYFIHSLKRKCSSFMVKNLSVDNVCQVILLAEKFEDSELLDTALKFVAGSISFMGSALWNEFAENNPIMAVKVFKKFPTNEFAVLF